MDVRPIQPLPTSPPPPNEDDPAALIRQQDHAEAEAEAQIDFGIRDSVLDIASLLSFLAVKRADRKERKDRKDTRGREDAEDADPSDSGSLVQSQHDSPSTSASPGSVANDPDENEDNEHSWMTLSDMTLLRDLDGDPEPEMSAERKDSVSANIDGAGGGKIQNWHRIPRLPKGTKVVKFVGEGCANAVFEILVPKDSPASHKFKGKLLRVAKVASLGQTPTYDYTFQHSFYKKVIKPILGEYAVHQDLAILHNSGVIDQMNALLTEIDDTRKPRFRGTFVGQSSWGFLVEDMRPGEDDSQIFIEFKPKWLLQSPSAPKKAIRCRQCALDFRKFILDPTAAKPAPQSKPCPLALGCPWVPEVVRSPSRIASSVPGTAMEGKRFEAALEQIMDHDVIHLLRQEQDRLDKKGPLHADPQDQTQSLAMTIRDCTLFALIPIHHSGDDSSVPIKIRLCDFDWKDPQVKAKRWASTEKALIDEGFYTADWLLCHVDGVTAYYHPPTLCALEFMRRDSSHERLRGLDIIALQEEEAISEELKSMMGPESALTIHMKTMDRQAILAVQEALEEFRKEPEGTPQDALYNPLRPLWI